MIHGDTSAWKRATRTTSVLLYKGMAFSLGGDTFVTSQWAFQDSPSSQVPGEPPSHYSGPGMSITSFIGSCQSPQPLLAWKVCGDRDEATSSLKIETSLNVLVQNIFFPNISFKSEFWGSRKSGVKCKKIDWGGKKGSVLWCPWYKFYFYYFILFFLFIDWLLDCYVGSSFLC